MIGRGRGRRHPGTTCAVPVLWLDALVMNPDRTPDNPNVLVAEGRSWLIDHGAALPFQYSWGTVTEDSPRTAAYALDRHLFAATRASPG
mgnify:CR=1 FL=1